MEKTWIKPSELTDDFGWFWYRMRWQSEQEDWMIGWWDGEDFHWADEPGYSNKEAMVLKHPSMQLHGPIALPPQD